MTTDRAATLARVNFERRTLKSIVIGEYPVILNPGFARVASVHDEWRFDIDDPEAIIRAIKVSRLGAHIFSFSQRIPFMDPLFGYKHDWTNVAALPLTTYDEWWKRGASAATRNKVRKAQKSGLEIRRAELDDNLVRGIQSIYNETPTRQGRRFAHYNRDLREIREMHETYLDRAAFYGAFLGSELVGFCKLVDTGRAMRTMGIMSKIGHRATAPNNALMNAAVKHCCDAKKSHLIYGLFEWGNRGSSGLMEYKRENGFQKVLLPRYFVPLTPIGRLLIKAGLEKGLVELIPGFVLRRALEARRFVMETGYRSLLPSAHTKSDAAADDR